MPGATRVMNMTHCQQTQYACQLDCTWDTGIIVTPAGECSRGYRDCALPDYHRVCDATCHWVDDPTCM